MLLTRDGACIAELEGGGLLKGREQQQPVFLEGLGECGEGCFVW